MNKFATIFIIAVTTLSTLAGHPPKHQQQRQEKEKANEETKHKIAHYQTDEGVSGTRAWKEYTANPKANGPTTLLVVFGGRDSFSRGAGPGPTVPAAIERALDYARRHSTLGKVIVLVPEMTVEVLPKTGHAESEETAYAKQEAWKWLFR